MAQPQQIAAPLMPDNVARIVAGYPPVAAAHLRNIRDLIYAMAAADSDIGPITETLKWNEPAYLTEATGSGTTIRLAWKESNPDRIGIYVHCQTNIIETLRAMLPDDIEFEGNRALLLDIAKPLPAEPVRIAVRMAMTYHLAKRGKG